MFRYSPKQITFILEYYVNIHCGEYIAFKHPTFNKKNKHDVNRADFEDSIVYKTDIDQAIDKLNPVPGKWLHYCKFIEEKPNGFGLSRKQFACAKFIQGYEYYIPNIIKELAAIA